MNEITATELHDRPSRLPSAAEASRRNRRVLMTRHGGPDVLHLVEEELPEPRPGEIRVKILAAGVSFPDLLIREGTYPDTPPLPFALGYELVGIVDALGAGVTTLTPGQPVAAMTVVGSYADYRCLPAEELVPVPQGLDPAEAVSLVLNYLTAYQLLHRAARVRSGERLLVQGAAGGVGTAVLQLGRLAGLTLYGTAAGPKGELVARLGATPIDYTREDFVARIGALTGDGVDVVLDGIGGPVSLRSYRVLRRGGRLVLFGHHATLARGRRSWRRVVAFYACGAATMLLNLVPDGRRVLTYRCARLKARHPDWFRQDLATLFDLLARGIIQPVIAGRLPLAEVRRAHEMLGRGEVSGKLVLLCHPA
jgi:NADPH2:quinone reductase